MWYKDGLSFKCTGCSHCCTGSPGVVWLEKKDLSNISSFLKISEQAFINSYTRQIGNRLSLKELLPYYDCIFLKDKKCFIYPVRPLQCRTYPFWPHILKDPKKWNEEASRCPGINSNNILISFEEIEKKLKEEREVNYEYGST